MDIPTKEDIQKILEVCNSLEKSAVLVRVSNGLAANEIRNLKIKDFKMGMAHKQKLQH